MEWNGIAIGQKFFKRANALHPEDDAETYSETLAKQNLYYECYMTAFSKDELQKMLNKSMAGDIELPEEKDKIDIGKYRAAFADEAKVVMQEILSIV